VTGEPPGIVGCLADGEEVGVLRRIFLFIGAFFVLICVVIVLTTEPEERPAAVGLKVPEGCAEHVELLSAEHWAEELGRSVSSVLANHRINIWSQSAGTGSKGRKVGEMYPGSRAVVLDYDGHDYRVRSPLDGSIGWVGKIQVARTLWQDTVTRKRCAAPEDEGGANWRFRDDGLVECADGRLLATNDPARACR